MRILCVLTLVLVGSSVFATSYPRDSQEVRMVRKGPSVVAVVSDVTMSNERFVLGYRRGSQFALSRYGNKTIYAVIWAICSNGVEKKNEFTLPGEASGNGYVNFELFVNQITPMGCYNSTLREYRVVYHDENGHWDPTNSDENYIFTPEEFNLRENRQLTGSSPNGQISDLSRQVIINALKE